METIPPFENPSDEPSLSEKSSRSLAGIVSSSVSALLLSGCVVLHEPGRVYSQPYYYSQPTYVPVQRTYHYPPPAPRVIYVVPRHHHDRHHRR